MPMIDETDIRVTITCGQAEALRMLKATDYGLVLWALDGWLREQCKYDDLPSDRVEAYEDVREQLSVLMAEYAVEFPE